MASRLRVRVRRVGLGSIGSISLLVALIASCLPAACLGLAAGGTIRSLRQLLDGWTRIEIPLVLGQQVRIDLLERLNLAGVAELLRSWDRQLLMVELMVGFGAFVALAIVIIVTGVVLGVSYNVLARGTGGLMLELEAVDGWPQ